MKYAAKVVFLAQLSLRQQCLYNWYVVTTDDVTPDVTSGQFAEFGMSQANCTAQMLGNEPMKTN